jgi:hypothetical protein
MALPGRPQHGEAIRTAYKLPVTVVRLAGSITRTTDLLHPGREPVVTRTVSVSLDVRADPRPAAHRRLEVPAVKHDAMKVALAWLDDGRLVSSDAAVTDSAANELEAVAGTGVAVAAGALALGVPPVGAAVAALAGAALVTRAEPVPGQDPTPRELGIDDGYQRDLPHEHQLLYLYRLALAKLGYAHAAAAVAAAEGTAETAAGLWLLDKALASTRTEAAHAEDRYARWLEEHVQRETEVVDHTAFVDELPTSRELHAALGRPASERLAWYPTAVRLQVAVTCDLDEVPGTAPGSAPELLAYRAPVGATVTTWQLERVPQEPLHWTARAVEVRRVQVTHPAFEQVLDPRWSGESSGSLNAAFAPSGALVSLSSEARSRVAERAEALSALPAHLSAAAASGTALGAALSPVAARLAHLKQRVEDKQQSAALDGLLHPVPDSLQALRDQLAEAELEARLAVAHHQVQDPSSVSLVVRTVDAGS